MAEIHKITGKDLKSSLENDVFRQIEDSNSEFPFISESTVKSLKLYREKKPKINHSYTCVWNRYSTRKNVLTRHIRIVRLFFSNSISKIHSFNFHLVLLYSYLRKNMIAISIRVNINSINENANVSRYI